MKSATRMTHHAIIKEIKFEDSRNMTLTLTIRQLLSARHVTPQPL